MRFFSHIFPSFVFDSIIYLFSFILSRDRFEWPGEKVMVVDPKFPPKEEYRYIGDGLDHGVCGIYKRAVSRSNHGKVKCTLGINGEELAGEISVVVASEYSSSKWHYPNGSESRRK